MMSTNIRPQNLVTSALASTFKLTCTIFVLSFQLSIFSMIRNDDVTIITSLKAHVNKNYSIKFIHSLLIVYTQIGDI